MPSSSFGLGYTEQLTSFAFSAYSYLFVLGQPLDLQLPNVETLLYCSIAVTTLPLLVDSGTFPF